MSLIRKCFYLIIEIKNRIIDQFARGLSLSCVSHRGKQLFRKIFVMRLEWQVIKEKEKEREEENVSRLIKLFDMECVLVYIAIATFCARGISPFSRRIPILTPKSPVRPLFPPTLRRRTRNYKFPQWAAGFRISLPSLPSRSNNLLSPFPSPPTPQFRQPPFSSFTAVGLSYRTLIPSLFLSLSLTNLRSSSSPYLLSLSLSFLASLSPDTSGLSRCARAGT